MNEMKRVLSADEAIEYQEWHEPMVKGRIASDHDNHLQPPTAGQMQLLQDDAYKEAFEQGRKEGFNKGYQEGQVKAEAEVKNTIQYLHSICLTLAKPLEQLDDEIEQNLVELTLSIAKQLVRRELKIEPGEIIGIVKQAIGALPVSARNPIIYLHPEDLNLVRQALSIGDEDRSWRIEEDLLLKRGDCRVETESSYIDSTIEGRLAAIAVNMLGDDRRQEDES